METTDLQLFKQTVILDENNDIFIQPLCDFFGINVKNQQRFIQKDPVLLIQGTKKSHEIIFGDNYTP